MDVEQLKKEHNVLRDKIAQAEELLQEPRDKLRSLRMQLEKYCPDTCDNMYVEEIYVPGTYLDSSYTTYYHKCPVCGKSREMRTEHHGTHG